MANRLQIGVLDCNNFFVSCERLFRPDLRQKPVVVLSSNDGCVVARSQEVKDMGIPMGVPYFKVKDILNQQKVTVFSSHFALYRDVSRRVFEVLRNELSQVEQYSVDEAFFVVPVDVTATDLGYLLKDKVEQQIGIPVSVGIGFSKTQAKAAVDYAKKAKGSGVHVWSDTTWRTYVVSAPLPSVWGVGANLELRYKEHGLLTIDDLLQADSARVNRLFGVAGSRLQQELFGVPVHALGASVSRQQSVMSSRSFKAATEQYAVVADAVAYHVRHVAETLRGMQVGTTEIRVSIRPSRHGDYVLKGGSLSAVLPTATNDTFVLLAAATDLLSALFEQGVPYKKAGVVVFGLQSEPGSQGNLFMETRDTNPLCDVLDVINAKTGTELITLGNRLQSSVWGTRVDMRSPAYTTRWSDIPSVKAE